MTGVWVTNDTISSTRMNEKTVFQGTGAAISALGTTYAGMLAFCTSSGSGFVVDNLYVRDATNTTWNIIGIDELPYLALSTTIGDYTSPNAAVATSTGLGSDDVWVPANTAKARVNLTNDNIDFDFEDNLTSNSAIYNDLGSARSDSAWVLRFKINFTSADANSRTWFGLSSVVGNQATSQDFIGLLVHHVGGNLKLKTVDTDGVSLPYDGDNTSTLNASLSTNYWIQITRLTTTTYEIKIYSDAYTTLIETVTGTCASTTASLRYIVFCNRNDFDSTNKQVGIIDDVAFQNAVTTFTAADFEDDFSSYAAFTLAASNVYDDSTTTPWESLSVSAPAIYVDLSGSAREIVGVALNINKTTTTITSIKIRASTDTSFDDTENIAYVNISDFTDDTWRFLANNFIATNKRYVQIIGVGTGVLSINEIKVRYGVSDAVKILGHKHRTRVTDAVDSFVDSN